MTVESPAPVYGNVNGDAEVIVSGDWLSHGYDNPPREGYKIGYTATIFRDGWFPFGCTPFMTREVVDRLVADQNAIADAEPTSGVGHLVWEGDTLVYQDGDNPEDWIRSGPTPEGYRVGFGWTWCVVGYDECDEVVGDAPRTVTIRLTYPQRYIDSHGLDDVAETFEARLDEVYPGVEPNDEVFSPGHIEVTVA